MSGYTQARKNANKNWDDKNLDRISIALPKGSKETLKEHAEKHGESVNGFIKRAIMETKEMDHMHRAYQRSLLRTMKRQQEAMECNDYQEAKRLLHEMIEDIQTDLGE